MFFCNISILTGFFMGSLHCMGFHTHISHGRLYVQNRGSTMGSAMLSSVTGFSVGRSQATHTPPPRPPETASTQAGSLLSRAILTQSPHTGEYTGAPCKGCCLMPSCLMPRRDAFENSADGCLSRCPSCGPETQRRW